MNRERGKPMKKKAWILAVAGCFFMSLFCLDQSMATMSNYIPGAHNVMANRYDDLTTNNPAIGKLAEAHRIFLYLSDWSPDGKIGKKPAWYTPKEKIPGLQIEGMFADSRFVIRIPDQWNGKLVVAGIPGMRDERSADDVFGDYVLARGFAYAASDKGTVGELIPAPDGKIYPFAKALTVFANPEDRVEKWNVNVRQLTLATQELLSRTRGKKPDRTYLMGYSNGGYAVRFALERDGDLYDGAVDWSGLIWRANDANIISSIADALNSYSTYANKASSDAEKTAALKRLRALGLPEGSEFLWPFHAAYYYLGTLNIFRMAYDPTFKQRSWWEYGLHPEDYKNYDYFNRPASVKETIAKFENTGDIKKPLITLHGTWDALLFSYVHALFYDRLVKDKKKGELHRLYLIEKGNHLDALVGKPDVDPKKMMQPLLPMCIRPLI